VRIIPVIDLRDGRAVHGRSGDRARYRPVRSRLLGGEPDDLSDPLDLLAAYRERLRPERVYVADLDRIDRRGHNDELLLRMLEAAPETRLLWDGGLEDAVSIAGAPSNGRIEPVIGTETLKSIEELRSLRRPGTGSRPVLSLDLAAHSVVTRSALLAPFEEEAILRRAEHLGLRSVIVLFLDRIGTGAGLPRARLSRLRRAAPRSRLIAGGGIASIDDLDFLRDAGYEAALIATALHDGTIGVEDLRRAGYLD